MAFKKDTAKREAIRVFILANPSKPTAHIAQELGVSKGLVLSVRRTMGEDYVAVVPNPQAKPKRERTDEEDRELVKLREEVTALRKKVKDFHKQALDDDAMREILGVAAAHTVSTPEFMTKRPAKTKGKGTPEVPVLMLADWHNGERVEPSEIHGINEYSIEICTRRVHNVVEGAIHLARNVHKQNYPGAVVPLVGDLVSGMLHPELAKTDEEDVLPCAMLTADLVIWALERLVDEFGKLYVPMVSGNHGRTTHKPEFKNYVGKNIDWLIYQIVMRHFAGHKNIVFDCPATNEVHFRIYGKRFLLMHGDMMGVKGGDGIIGVIGPIMRGAVKVGRQQSAIGKDFDILLMGHWHQQLWLPGAIVGNTLKGFDEYAKNALRAVPTPPSQALFFVHPTRGITSRWEVQAENPKAEVSADWVSVFNR